MNKELELRSQITGLSGSVNHGIVSVESDRAVAEAQGQMLLAKRFPRNLVSANAELVESCSQMSLAEVAFFSIPRAGVTITGPSIRLAEEIARVVGNIEYGHRELSRDDHKSEVEVYAWDKQTNTRAVRHMTVMHIIDKKEGPKKCTSQKDIDDLISNKASKHLRGRILAIMPKWLVESAITECKKTLIGKNPMPLSQKIRNLQINFQKHGVSVKSIESYIGKSTDEMLEDEFLTLVGVYNSIREGKKASDFFGDKEDNQTSNLESKIASAAKTEQATEIAKPEPAPTASEPKPEVAKPKTVSVAKPKPQEVKTPEQKTPDPVPEPEAELPPVETYEDPDDEFKGF